MAVIANALGSKLQLRLQAGTGSDGRTLYKNKTISGLKAAASDQDLHEVAQALVSLQTLPLASVKRTNDVELVNV